MSRQKRNENVVYPEGWPAFVKILEKEKIKFELSNDTDTIYLYAPMRFDVEVCYAISNLGYQIFAVTLEVESTERLAARIRVSITKKSRY